MSKRDLKKYLEGLSQVQASEQIVELYEKFPQVKAYYDFVFRPNEDKLLRDAISKISNEYFPVKTKRPKLRRSVAQKIIKHFLLLGVDPVVTIEVMLHSVETAIKYSAGRPIRYESFYKSIHTAFEQAIRYTDQHGMVPEFRGRLSEICANVFLQRWPNSVDFSSTLDNIVD